MKLPYVTSSNAEALALSVSAIAFSAVVLFIGPAIGSLGTVSRVFAAILAGLSLAAIFSVFRRLLHGSWSQPLRGIWLYMTEPHDEAKRHDRGFGVAEISVSPSGHIEYSVDLYRDGQDAMRAANGETVKGHSHGTARGVATHYDDAHGALWILYRVEYFSPEDPNREGHLFVRAAGPVGQREMQGVWASDLNGRELSAGRMVLMRPADFPDYLTSLGDT